MTTNFLECGWAEWVICSESFTGLISLLLYLWKIHEPFLIYLNLCLSRIESLWSAQSVFAEDNKLSVSGTVPEKYVPQVFKSTWIDHTQPKFNFCYFKLTSNFCTWTVIYNIQLNYLYAQGWVCAQKCAGPALTFWALQHRNTTLFFFWSFAIHFPWGKPSSITGNTLLCVIR